MKGGATLGRLAAERAVLIVALSAATEACSTPTPPTQPSVGAPRSPTSTVLATQGGALTDAIRARAAVELVSLRAARTGDLVDGAPNRSLIIGEPRARPYSGGRVLSAPVLVEPGPPAMLRVPTDLSIVITLSVAHDGDITVLERPTHEDLAEAMGLAARGEARALETAAQALRDAGKTPPSNRASWGDALVVAVLDARVPRDRLVGPPSWHLMFEPFLENGWTAVLLDAETFAVMAIDGRVR